VTAAEFARNLRGALPAVSLCFRQAEKCPFAAAEIRFGRARDLFFGVDPCGQPADPPTPEEIAAIATALGCPVERLTVSREELERRLEVAEEQYQDLKYERDRLAEVAAEYSQSLEEVAYEASTLRASVAELEAANADLTAGLEQGWTAVTGFVERLRNARAWVTSRGYWPSDAERDQLLQVLADEDPDQGDNEDDFLLPAVPA
jgi:hypothetical protein